MRGQLFYDALQLCSFARFVTAVPTPVDFRISKVSGIMVNWNKRENYVEHETVKYSGISYAESN